MKKIILLLSAIVLLAFSTACINSGTSSSQGTNSKNGGSSSSQRTVSPNSGFSSRQGNKQPGADQQVDSAYNLQDLIDAVKNAGCISGEPESLDVKDIGAEQGISYGNVVFLQYDLYSSNAYFDAYEAGQVTINGKTVKIGAINGPYFMIFMDEKVDQNAVKAFRSLGFGT